ncbi:MAG: hypothetical protein J7L43_02740, partial [Candidatus Aenigmarchaeota archaeon]|nr:hypothetical protein [Candidatus Aenigmarchaeota archaeon]
MIGYATINDGTGDINIVADDIEVKKSVNRKTEYGLTGSRNPAFSADMERSYEGSIKIKAYEDKSAFIKIMGLVLGASSTGSSPETATETQVNTLPEFNLRYGIKELNTEYTVTGCVVKSAKMSVKKGAIVELDISFVAKAKTSGSYNAPSLPSSWFSILPKDVNAALSGQTLDIFEIDVNVDNDVEVNYPLKGSAEPDSINVNKRKKSGKISFKTTSAGVPNSLIEDNDGADITISIGGD